MRVESGKLKVESEEIRDLGNDMQEILIIAHRVADECDRKRLADIAEKWLIKVKDEK